MVRRKSAAGPAQSSPIPKAIERGRRSARSAGLRYVTDNRPGIRRVAKGHGFVYYRPSGRVLRAGSVLRRIKSLGIPPAWRDVWICPLASGHLQATGYDARDRKQHLYHPAWQVERDRQKYDKMLEFARALPKIRSRVRRDLSRRGLPREKVLAAVVRLMEQALIRVGNREYARQNGSFGLTTIRNRHARVRGSQVRFDFRGKHQVEHEIEIRDSKLAAVVRQCQDLPGQELFEYVDEEGRIRDVGSGDVNDYLRDIAGKQFSAKDFRTWAGTVAAAAQLGQAQPCDSRAASKRSVNQAIDEVARQLGNTRAVCRRCYIHPRIIQSFLAGDLRRALRGKSRGKAKYRGLDRQEIAVLGLLQAEPILQSTR